MLKRVLGPLTLAALILVATAPSAQAGVLTGIIDHVPESVVNFTWGDGEHDLIQRWSVRQENSEGWFYGVDYPHSNGDVYVCAGLADPTTVTDASIFPYESGALAAVEGSTVFYRGENGYYGAWFLANIYSPADPDDPNESYLDGIWYFVTDQSADFSQGSVAREMTTLSRVKALFD